MSNNNDGYLRHGHVTNGVKYGAFIRYTKDNRYILSYEDEGCDFPKLEIDNNKNEMKIECNLNHSKLIVTYNASGIIFNNKFNNGKCHDITLKEDTLKFVINNHSSISLEKVGKDKSFFKVTKQLYNGVTGSSLPFESTWTYNNKYIKFNTYKDGSKKDLTFDNLNCCHLYDDNNKAGICIGYEITNGEYTYILTTPDDNNVKVMKYTKDYIYYYLGDYTCFYKINSNKMHIKSSKLNFGYYNNGKFLFQVLTKSNNKYLKKNEYNIDDEFFSNFFVGDDCFVDLTVRDNKNNTICTISPIGMGNNDVSCEDIFDELNPENDAEVRLSKLVGLETVKSSIRRIKAYYNKNRKDKINLHMAFLGNPGTGKTVVAKLMGDILYKNKALPTNTCLECTRRDLVANYHGQTADKTFELVKKALGGVLFVDEAYSLAGGLKDYGSEAIDVLLKQMEDHKSEFCCVLAGYENEMQKLFNMNPGFVSRIQFHINFEDYNIKELEQILLIHLKNYNVKANKDVISSIVDIIDYKRLRMPNFSNAREVRNIVESIAMYATDRSNYNGYIIEDDVIQYMNENSISKKSIKEFNMFSNEELQAFYKAKYTPQNYIKKQQDLFESIISINLNYSQNITLRTGFVITPNGYAITYGKNTKESLGAIAKRHVYDRYGNIVETVHNVSLALDKDNINIIKLSNDNPFEYIPLDETLSIKEFLDTKLRVIGTSKENSDVVISCGYDASSIIITKLNNDLTFEFKSLENENYNIGSAIIEPNTCKVVGIVIDENLALPIDNIIEIIKNQ